MKNQLTIIALAIIGLFVHCGPDKVVSSDLDGLIELNLPYDTVQVVQGHKAIHLAAFGTYYFEEELVVSHRGLYTSYSEVKTLQDTSIVQVDRKVLHWTSDDPSVASVENGKVKFHAVGSTHIRANAGSIVSNDILVVVEAQEVNLVYIAPELNLNPPLRVLTFSGTAVVDGSVTVGSDLFINSSISTYDAQGTFANPVSGLQLGQNDVAVLAVHALDETKQTIRSKTIIYEQASADNSIVGSWEGLAAGYNFYFDVTYNENRNRFDISGRLILEIQSQGINQEIIFEGLVDQYGRMQVVINQDIDQLTVTGGLKGFFSDEGDAAGEIFLKSQILLFTQKESENWNAQKVD